MNDLFNLLNNFMGLDFGYQDNSDKLEDTVDELEDISEELDNILNSNKAKKIDLTNDEDYNKIVDKIKKLRSNTGTFKLISSIFGINDEVYDSLLELLEKRRNELLEEKEEIESKAIEVPVRKVIDKSEEPKKEEIHRPSQDISVEAGLQIHKLVQEYIDTMIKPYNPKVGGLTNNQINDAYAGLYEFACWIFNK